MCVFLPSDTEYSNQDTKFILEHQKKEVGFGESGCFIYLTLKKKKRQVIEFSG